MSPELGPVQGGELFQGFLAARVSCTSTRRRSSGDGARATSFSRANRSINPTVL